MKNILVLGAGRSSSSLIDYLVGHAQQGAWTVTVADANAAAAQQKTGNAKNTKAIAFDIADERTTAAAIKKADVVVSLMPAHFHPIVAGHCLAHGKHLVNASYVSPEMKALHNEALKKDLLFLNECGLDPGIDHMSAMQVIDRIRANGDTLICFESFTGGLIAPDTDPDNPWRYKFTWNPRNVVMAGQGAAKYLQEGQYKYIPYQQLFKRTTTVDVPGFGAFEGYANRDSLKYLDTYNLHGVKTMLRGTLRNAGYCAAWNVLVQLGCCDDTYTIDNVATMRHRDFISSFLTFHPSRSVEENVCATFNLHLDGEEMKRLRWSGFFSDEPVGISNATPAQVVEHILAKRWTLQPGDKDLIVMWHRFVYATGGKHKEIQSYLTATGDDEVRTAMAKTVGLPVAIAVKLLLQGKITTRGVAIPVVPEIYNPILEELATVGVRFLEIERQL